MTLNYDGVICRFKNQAYPGVLAWFFRKQDKTRSESRLFSSGQFKGFSCGFLLQALQRLNPVRASGRNLHPSRLEKRTPSITSFLLNPFSQKERM